MRVVGVGLYVGESDFFGGVLLEKEFVFVVEEEDGEGMVKEIFVDVGYEMVC